MIILIDYCALLIKRMTFNVIIALIIKDRIKLFMTEFSEVGNIGQISRVIFVVVQSCVKWSHRTYYYLHSI